MSLLSQALCVARLRQYLNLYGTCSCDPPVSCSYLFASCCQSVHQNSVESHCITTALSSHHNGHSCFLFIATAIDPKPATRMIAAGTVIRHANTEGGQWETQTQQQQQARILANGSSRRLQQDEDGSGSGHARLELVSACFCVRCYFSWLAIETLGLATAIHRRNGLQRRSRISVPLGGSAGQHHHDHHHAPLRGKSRLGGRAAGWWAKGTLIVGGKQLGS